MTKFRIEIDAIIAVIAATPKEALEQANAFVREVGSNTETPTRLIITGEDSIPTVLTLSDPIDIESIDAELSSSEVGDLESGREPDVVREEREVEESKKRVAEGRTTDALEEMCEDCGNAAYVVVNNRPLCDLHALAELH